MAKKFIPNGDADFLVMAERFARGVAKAPATYDVSPDASVELTATVGRFCEALQAASSGARSPVATARKEAARVDAERLIRRIANAVRANLKIDAIARMNLGIRERSKSSNVQRVPNEAPLLDFQRAIHARGDAPEHELTFCAQDDKPRPAGAARLELFVDLIPPDATPETYYREARTRPIYLRSYTRSPIRVVPPMADRAMRVVYFARWADTSGDVGPISKPAVGWVEGGAHHLMGPALGGGKRPMAWGAIDDEARSHETTVVVALVAAARLTDARSTTARQIEGPVDVAA